MNRLFYLFFYFTFIHAIAFASTVQLTGDYNVRPTLDDIRTKTESLGILKAGSVVRILEVTSFGKNRGEALRIEVMKAGKNSNFEIAEQMWIYRSKNVNYLTETEAQIVDGLCNEGCKNSSATKNTVASKKNLHELKSVTEKAYEEFETVKTKVSTYLDEKIKNYSLAAKASINWAMKHKHSTSQGKCYLKVKEALSTAFKGKKSNSKILPGWYSDVTAANAKESLKNFGFINLLETEPYKSEIKSPTDAPQGAVLVYSSGVKCAGYKDCGHVEIKVGRPGEPGYVSDYYSKDAVNESKNALRFGSRYKLIGVMIKPLDEI